jgi:hypothetical protein
MPVLHILPTQQKVSCWRMSVNEKNIYRAIGREGRLKTPTALYHNEHKTTQFDRQRSPANHSLCFYTRYSSEEQRKTSTEDQVRNCRVTAERNRWLVLDEYIRSDEETTGRTLAGRQGIADLIQLAKQRPKPFDCILIDDTSRLGRYLPDVLRECDRLMHHGVFLYFASDRLDSRDGSFRIMHIFKGYRDEDFVRDLGHKIHRGQEGVFSTVMSQETVATVTETFRSPMKTERVVSVDRR